MTRPTAATPSGSGSGSSSWTGQAADRRHRAPAAGRGLEVPVLIDYIHVSGYIGKAAAACTPANPPPPASGPTAAAARPARTREGRRRHPRRRRRQDPRESPHPPPGLTDVDKAVTYLENNRERMRYDKALKKGWPIATGMIEAPAGRNRRRIREPRCRTSPNGARSSSSSRRRRQRRQRPGPACGRRSCPRRSRSRPGPSSRPGARTSAAPGARSDSWNRQRWVAACGNSSGTPSRTPAPVAGGQHRARMPRRRNRAAGRPMTADSR